MVNSDSTSRLAIKRELSWSVIYLGKLNESLKVNSLWVKGSKIRIKNFTWLYPGVLIAYRIGLNLCILSTTGLWTFELPYRFSGLWVTHLYWLFYCHISYSSCGIFVGINLELSDITFLTLEDTFPCQLRLWYYLS